MARQTKKFQKQSNFRARKPTSKSPVTAHADLGVFRKIRDVLRMSENADDGDLSRWVERDFLADLDEDWETKIVEGQIAVKKLEKAYSRAKNLSGGSQEEWPFVDSKGRRLTTKALRNNKNVLAEEELKKRRTKEATVDEGEAATLEGEDRPVEVKATIDEAQYPSQGENKDSSRAGAGSPRGLESVAEAQPATKDAKEDTVASDRAITGKIASKKKRARDLDTENPPPSKVAKVSPTTVIAFKRVTRRQAAKAKVEATNQNKATQKIKTAQIVGDAVPQAQDPAPKTKATPAAPKGKPFTVTTGGPNASAAPKGKKVSTAPTTKTVYIGTRIKTTVAATNNKATVSTIRGKTAASTTTTTKGKHATTTRIKSDLPAASSGTLAGTTRSKTAATASKNETTTAALKSTTTTADPKDKTIATAPRRKTIATASKGVTKSAVPKKKAAKRAPKSEAVTGAPADDISFAQTEKVALAAPETAATPTDVESDAVADHPAAEHVPTDPTDTAALTAPVPQPFISEKAFPKEKAGNKRVRNIYEDIEPEFLAANAPPMSGWLDRLPGQTGLDLFGGRKRRTNHRGHFINASSNLEPEK